MVTIEIVINFIRVMGIRVTISCRYACPAWDDAYVSSSLFNAHTLFDAELTNLST